MFAGFSLALILYMTEYHPHHLQKGFMGTMTNLYYESNSGSMLPEDLLRFTPAIGYVPRFVAFPVARIRSNSVIGFFITFTVQPCIFLAHWKPICARTATRKYPRSFQMKNLACTSTSVASVLVFTSTLVVTSDPR